jgi:hypothetical protein
LPVFAPALIVFTSKPILKRACFATVGEVLQNGKALAQVA